MRYQRNIPTNFFDLEFDSWNIALVYVWRGLFQVRNNLFIDTTKFWLFVNESNHGIKLSATTLTYVFVFLVNRNFMVTTTDDSGLTNSHRNTNSRPCYNDSLWSFIVILYKFEEKEQKLNQTGSRSCCFNRNVCISS